MDKRQTYSSDFEGIAEAYGRNQGRQEERARIRKELEAAIEPEIRIVCVPGSRMEIEVLLVSYLRATLDRICPE